MSFTDSKVPVQRAYMISFKRGTITVLRSPARRDHLTMLVTHVERPQPRALDLEITEALELVDLLNGDGFTPTEPMPNGEQSSMRTVAPRAGGLMMACTFAGWSGWIMFGVACEGSPAAASFDLSAKTRGVFADALKRVITEGAAHV